MKRVIKPPVLTKGAVVGVIAPSDYLNADEKNCLAESAKTLESWGLEVKFGKHVFSRVKDFAAGSADGRRGDLLTMVDDPQVKAIWAAKGGYAATEVLPVFTPEVVKKLRANPKWFLGYSDMCILLNALALFGIASVHAPSLWDLINWDERTRSWLRKMLFGASNLEMGSQSRWKTVIPGKAEGALLVSNFESLVFTFGTRFDPLLHGDDNIILCLEELEVEKSLFQRWLDALINHEKSARVRGLVWGRLVGIDEHTYPEWGKTVKPEALIADRIRRWKKIPLAFWPVFGHHAAKSRPLQKRETFLSLPNGIRARLTVGSDDGRLQFLEPIVGKS